MIIEEFKRVLFIQKGIWLIPILLIASILIYINRYENYIVKEQYQVLSECYIPYEGPLTEEKIRMLEAEYEKSEGDEGWISVSYKSICEKARKTLEEMETPYLVYGNGWNSLIGNLADNNGLLITLLILAVLIFGFDAGHKMQNLLNTLVNGRRKLIITRILVYIAMSLAVILVQGCTEYIIAKECIGLRHPKAPIQCISAFKDCTLKISLVEAYIVVLAFKFVGAVIGGMLVCFVATITRNIYVSVVAGVLVLFEGYFFSGLYDYRYLIPQHLFVSYNTLMDRRIHSVIAVAIVVIVLLLIGILAFNNERSRRRLV